MAKPINLNIAGGALAYRQYSLLKREWFIEDWDKPRQIKPTGMEPVTVDIKKAISTDDNDNCPIKEFEVHKAVDSTGTD